MISKKLEAAINAQINAEMWSAYLYLSMSAYCHKIGYSGIANWYMVQFREEQDHALILYKYVQSRGGVVTLQPIEEVQTEWPTLLSVFEATLAHEEKVTSLLNNIMSIAHDEKDYATQSRLQWFIDEQVEEEETAGDLIQKVKQLDGNSYGMYVLDQELASRTYTQASPLATAE